MRPGLARVVLVGGIWLFARGPAVAGRPSPSPTYHKDVVPILQKHCQDCHRPGQVAPFSLLTYAQARKRGPDLVTVTDSHKMPPWPASTTEGGPFRDVRRLSPSERTTLAAWAETGCSEGNVKEAPPSRSWSSDWPLGEPDLVLAMPEAYAVGPEGRDELRVFVIPTHTTEGKWIAAVDFRPGNPKVVHHLLCALDTMGRARKLDAADPKPGYGVFGGFGVLPSGGMGGWAPGKQPQRLPDGVGRYLSAGADVLLQIHYHCNGKAESDTTKVGLYFARRPVEKQVRGMAVTPPRPGLLSKPTLRIPAGDPNYEVKGNLTVGRDAHLTAVVPHMHWVGKDFLLRATRPDGSIVTLIRIDDWDFNWQATYDFVEPVALPKGTRIDMLAHYDNSAENPSNPNTPPAEVRWGEQTTDEMCIGFLQVTYDDEHLGNRPPIASWPTRRERATTHPDGLRLRPEIEARGEPRG
jgi:Copper type II ascorbate-dependent monooxygenase, C-terminal domain